MNEEKSKAYRNGVFDGYSGVKNNASEYKYTRTYNKGFKEGRKKAQKEF